MHLVGNTFGVFLTLTTLVLSVDGTQGECHLLPRDANKAGIRIQGNLIYAFTSTSRVNCLHACFEITACWSVNLQPNTGVCELNSANSSTANSSEIVTDNTFVLLDIVLWSKNMGGACANKPCAANQRCLDRVHFFECTETECPTSLIGPQNGLITYSSGSSVGSVATVSCVSEYRRSPSTYRSTRYCLTNSSWELVPEFDQITCIRTSTTLGKTCSKNSDCLETGDNFRCVAGHCFCKLRYKYDVNKGICVEACQGYLNTTSITKEGQYIAGHDKQSPTPHVGLEKCKIRCYTRCGDNSQCLGFEVIYNSTVIYCHCKSITWQQALHVVPESIQSDPTAIHYDWDCDPI